tara:strand:+ start:349 stop:600 length:252 start_codon:yes stop_codon:yes gene_type:complete
MDKRDKLHLRGSDLDWTDWFKSPHTKIVIELIEDIKIHKLEEITSYEFEPQKFTQEVAKRIGAFNVLEEVLQEINEFKRNQED